MNYSVFAPLPRPPFLCSIISRTTAGLEDDSTIEIILQTKSCWDRAERNICEVKRAEVERFRFWNIFNNCFPVQDWLRMAIENNFLIIPILTDRREKRGYLLSWWRGGGFGEMSSVTSVEDWRLSQLVRWPNILGSHCHWPITCWYLSVLSSSLQTTPSHLTRLTQKVQLKIFKPVLLCVAVEPLVKLTLKARGYNLHCRRHSAVFCSFNLFLLMSIFVKTFPL